jgi:hypothetical protein
MMSDGRRATAEGRWRIAPRVPHTAWQMCALIALALAASWIGVQNGFTYDDRYIIEWNARVHSLGAGQWWRLFGQSYWPKDWGSDGYRPVTMLLFAIEWVVGRGSPQVFHAVNIALNAAVSVAVFALASLMLPAWAAWLAAALFAVHPVHVEAVANVVGQSEIIVGLALCSAVVLFVRSRGGIEDGRTGGRIRASSAIAIVLLYAIGCLAKEHAMVLPALLVLAELLVVRDERSWRARWRELRPLTLGLAAVAVGFLGARSLVLSGMAGFHPFIVFQTLNLSYADRVLTMLGVAPHWLRLVLWPARLSMDYTPPSVAIAQGPALDQLPGFLLLTAVMGLALALWRRRPVTSFGILWAAITLLPSSNFIIPAGIILAERTLYLPTVGVMIALGDTIAWIAPQLSRRPIRVAALAGVSAAIVAATVWSARRTTAWHDNERLFRQTVADYPDSYRAHFMLGSWAFSVQRLSEGEREFQTAITLFPFDPSPAMALAEQYRRIGTCPQAIRYYRVALGIDPTLGRVDLIKCLVRERQYDAAKEQLRVAMEHSGASPFLHKLLVWAQSEETKSVAR